MNRDNQNQTTNAPPKQKPAQASSNARGKKQKTKTGMRAAEIQREALTNATTQSSMANFDAIFEGFEAMGIEAEDVIPRENVFTFNAWKALNRIVRKGQHGVRILTRVPCSSTDKETGEKSRFTRPKMTTVFHISQTDASAGEAEQPLSDEEQQARAAGFGCVAAWKNPNWMGQLIAHSKAYAEAVQNEQNGNPADYVAAFDILQPDPAPAGAVNIFDL